MSNKTMPQTKNRVKFQTDTLESLYRKYNKRQFVHPDPVEFLYDFHDIRDREIAGLIASSLAYGKVDQIRKSVDKVLMKMPQPYKFITSKMPDEFMPIFRGFKHRFTTDIELISLLIGIKRVIEQYGSLEKCFMYGYRESDETFYPALLNFARELSGGTSQYNSLIPMFDRKSCFKRMNLFLLWMIRKDDVSPGGWNRLPQSKLIIPLDTHMFKIGRSLGLTKRKTPDLQAALDITHAFRQISPRDPARYDFVLTRFGIHADKTVEKLLAHFGVTETNKYSSHLNGLN